ncbi:hypothetical protein DERP_012291 [Dermatophagoides pteronyssinus]|uniref:Uncharacterized protein n=1 Tax=Dermatophagoides pteronyssinus TaxID=6956 RepID=A0ABQ8JQB3_DERPT|nr:hypothetical protein DERP_012291 [Dermatophagoides pteronyssinus]
MLSTLPNEHVLIEEFDKNLIGSIDSIVELIWIFFALISGLASLRCLELKSNSKKKHRIQ